MDKPSALVTFISTELLLVAGLVGLHFLGVSTFTIGIVGSVLFVILNITFALTRPRGSLPSGETNWKCTDLVRLGVSRVGELDYSPIEMRR